MDLSNVAMSESEQSPRISPPPLHPRGRRWKRIVLGGGAVFAAVACAVALLRPSQAETTVTAYKESAVTRGTITAGISETGTLSIDCQTVKYNISEAKKEDLGLTVNVEEVMVKSGQKVAAGDPLLRISTADLQESLSDAQLTLRQAQADLTQSQLDQTLKKMEAESTYQSNLTLADTASLQYELTITELENEIENYEDQVTTLSRQTKFLRSYLSDQDYFMEHLDENPTNLKFGSYEGEGEGTDPSESQVRQQINTYRNELEEVEAKLQSAQLVLESKQKQAELTLDSDTFTADNAETLYQVSLSQIENSVTNAQLKVESAQNNIDEISAYLADDGIITAPISGTIMSLGYAAGDELSSSNPIAVISNPAEAYLSVSIVQEDITALEIGQSATITLDAFPDDVFTGSLDSMSVSPSRSGGSTVSYTVDTRFDTPNEKFFEGMTGNVTFITTQLKDVLMVSNRAITNTDGVQTVLVQNPDGTQETREITTGFSDGRNVEVLSGLEEGETVLIESQVAAS